MTTERMIFCLSPGRCGTVYIYNMMTTVPGVCSQHEHPPSFRDARRLSKVDKMKWLLEVQLPYILGLAQPVYFRSGPGFTHGWPELMLQAGFVPDVLVIRRPHREVALSLWRMFYIPARSITSDIYGINPEDDDNELRIENYSHWSDYQVCYWYCLEIERRIQKYIPMLRAAGSKVYETSTAVMTTQDGLFSLIDEMGLEKPNMAQFITQNVKVNQTIETVANLWPGGNMVYQERMVEDWANNVQ